MTNFNFLMFCFISITIFIGSSCRKEAPEQEETSIIEAPDDYIVFVRYKANNPRARYNDFIYDFEPGNKVNIYATTYTSEATDSYIIKGDTIIIVGLQQKITRDRVINAAIAGYPIEKFAIIAAPKTYLLGGKTFSGIYYKPDGSTLHSSFFYQFQAGSSTVKAGLELPNVVRESNCILIGNVAVFNNNIAGYPGDRETMVLVGNELYVNYYDQINDRKYHGVFTQE